MTIAERFARRGHIAREDGGAGAGAGASVGGAVAGNASASDLGVVPNPGLSWKSGLKKKKPDGVDEAYVPRASVDRIRRQLDLLGQSNGHAYKTSLKGNGEPFDSEEAFDYCIGMGQRAEMDEE